MRSARPRSEQPDDKVAVDVDLARVLRVEADQYEADVDRLLRVVGSRLPARGDDQTS